MKTKDELIKEAWGKWYDYYQPNENGWFFTLRDQDDDDLGGFSGEVEFDESGHGFRPLALKGLEDNNGWKTVSIDGLPKEPGSYRVWFKSQQKETNQFQHFEDNKAVRSFWEGSVSHWKPIDVSFPMW